MGFGQVFGILGYLFAVLVIAPVFPFLYVVLRWRTHGRDETGLGTYGALLYFACASLLVGVAGAANLAYGFISTTDASEELTRLSWGMFVGSLVFLLINLVLIQRVYPTPAHDDARRVFAGFLMIVTGMVSLGVLIMFGVTLFEKVDENVKAAVEQNKDMLKLYGSWLLFYLVSYLLVSRAMLRGASADSKGGR
ncbi:MAG: hypothetical protein ACYSX0_19565 [Planctomycetota bacterium]|jgi:hypothetical protein